MTDAPGDATPPAALSPAALTDEDVARLAADIALTFPAATSGPVQHALLRQQTLCGQGADGVSRQDDPFSPLATDACDACASAFATLAAVIPALELAPGWTDMRPRSGYHNQLKQQFGTELDAELAPDHALHGSPHVVVANAEDDVVLALTDGRVAVTRLTWSRQAETPPAPAAAFVDAAHPVPPAGDLNLGA